MKMQMYKNSQEPLRRHRLKQKFCSTAKCADNETQTLAPDTTESNSDTAAHTAQNQ